MAGNTPDAGSNSSWGFICGIRNAMAIQTLKVIGVLILLVQVSSNSSAAENINCANIVHVPCGERQAFSVKFDGAKKLAAVSLAPRGVRRAGDLEAAACYSAHTNQIPMLRKMLEHDPDGKGNVPASFSFEIAMHCEDASFIQLIQEP